MKTNIEDYEQIQKVLEEYAKEKGMGQRILEKIYHPNATINGKPIEEIATESLCCKQEPKARMDILDVYGDIACARVYITDCEGDSYVNYIQLIKRKGKWKIVSKTSTELL